MALYGYLKAAPKVPKNNFYFLSYGLVVMGTVFLANVFLPIFLYQLNRVHFGQELISPMETNQITVLGESKQGVDYNNPTNWFPSASVLPPRTSKITHYNLAIPKLKISQAVVQIGGEDLKKSLVHYPGTALPGQYGNVVIFGHSVLPQFFNPKNYKTIFSTLPTLEGGDDIFLDFDGVAYHYQVTQIVETLPEDVSILEQHYNGEYLTLVTCVPPGTYLKRLAVRARLVKF